MIVWMKSSWWAATAAIVSMAASSCGFHQPKYENPITKDTQQPDKVLYDKAIKDFEKGRYELSRLTLNTLINTYDSSEYLAKAKLAIADSWYREGGVSGFAQAEAEYKDFELFYPTMPEAAESQYKICKTSLRGDGQAGSGLQSVLARGAGVQAGGPPIPEFKVRSGYRTALAGHRRSPWRRGRCGQANFYYKKGVRPAAANRFIGLVDQYPLYSRADEALWKGADAYLGMGPRHTPQGGPGFAENRSRVSAGPLRGSGQEEVAGTGTRGPGSGSGGGGAHEV